MAERAELESDTGARSWAFCCSRIWRVVPLLVPDPGPGLFADELLPGAGLALVKATTVLVACC